MEENNQLVPASSALTFNTSILAGQVGASSIAMYARDFRAYIVFAGTPEIALNAVTLAKWRTHLAMNTAMSPNTINRMLSAVKRLIKEAAAQGYTTQEIALAFERVEGVKVAALRNRTKTTNRSRISPEQMKALTEAPDLSTLKGLRDAALLHTLASSGLRCSELAGLAIWQIIGEHGGYLLRVMGKNETEYEDAHLSATADAAIQRWLLARPITSDYIFTAFDGRGSSRATGRAMTDVAVWKLIKHYAEKVGIKNVSPHSFRRFVGTELAKTDIRKAQKALRHKRIETTAKHYVLDSLEVGLTDNLY